MEQTEEGWCKDTVEEEEGRWLWWKPFQDEGDVILSCLDDEGRAQTSKA